jgi:hypothetical protein
MSVEVFEQTCACDNCWTKATVMVEKPSDTGRPADWGFVRILVKGTPNGDRLLCGNCITKVMEGLAIAREDTWKPLDANGRATGEQGHI